MKHKELGFGERVCLMTWFPHKWSETFLSFCDNRSFRDKSCLGDHIKRLGSECNFFDRRPSRSSRNLFKLIGDRPNIYLN